MSSLAVPDDFRGFMAAVPEIIAAHPGAEDFTETRFASRLKNLRPEPDCGDGAIGYRCHVARFWLDTMGLPSGWLDRTLVCGGVRHGLSLLFRGFASDNLTAAIPADVYPVYGDLARAAGLRHLTFATRPFIDMEAAAHADILLLCNPVKPRGSALDETETMNVLRWLAADRQRRVLIDAVYTFDTEFDAATLRLLATGQGILLHSLSKAWLHPLVMGAALVPEGDVSRWVPVFREEPADRIRLGLAEAILTKARSFPRSLPVILGEGEGRMMDILRTRGITLPHRNRPAPRYLFVVEMSWRSLLEEHGMLALPMTVFGGREDSSVLSSLPLMPDHEAMSEPRIMISLYRPGGAAS